MRVEVTPKDIFSKKRCDWTLRVDEEKTLPAWFTGKRHENEELVWREWAKAMKATLWKLDLQAAKRVVAEAKAAPYFSMHAKPIKTWKLYHAQTWDAARGAAGDAAGDAAWDAARGAARGAARDAARDAAGDAAWDAARGAAWDAAWDAARDAAWDAAGDAAWDAELLARCKLARLKGKHLKHAEARWDVWRRGYAIKCDVNGVLYVYCLNKKPSKKGAK